MPKNDIANRVFERAQAMELLDALPRLAGLSEERVNSIRAKGELSAAEYEQLCRALAVDPVIMYRGEETQPNRAPVRFRAAISGDRPNGEDIRVLALAVEQGRILAHLLALLGKPIELAHHRTIHSPSVAQETWREGYTLGEAARSALSSEPGPIHELGRLFRRLGIHVAHMSFTSPDVDAASIWDPHAVPIILVNKTSPLYAHPAARRSMLAHELCHLLHDAGEQDLTTEVSWGSERSGNYSNALEIRARAFAPAFLAPRDQTKAWFQVQPQRVRNDPGKTVSAIAEHWGLSFEGSVWHAKNCEILDPQVAAGLAAQPSRQWRAYEEFMEEPMWLPPAMVNDDLPKKAAELWEGWATELVLAALDEGHITVGRARELLSWG